MTALLVLSECLSARSARDLTSPEVSGGGKTARDAMLRRLGWVVLLWLARRGWGLWQRRRAARAAR